MNTTMSKRTVAKAFNEAKIGTWSTITSEEIKLTNAFFESEEESREEINKLIVQYVDSFLTKAVQKKIFGLKALVNWPIDGARYKPIVSNMEVLRISANKYVLLIHLR